MEIKQDKLTLGRICCTTLFSLFTAVIFVCVMETHLAAQVSFTLSSSPAVGTNPRGVISADVNGDGAPDLISANQSPITGNTLSVLTNNGTGGFATAATLSAGSQPYSVAAADVNADGKIDLICANMNANSITVFTNNGSGGFAGLITVTVGTKPKCVIARDVNGDGLPDLITANSTAATLSILLNQGSGSYFTGVASSPATGTGPACVAAADVNGDGKVDLISANVSDSTRAFTVLTNNGTGTFSAATSPNNFFGSQWITASDVNGDGRMDLICVGSPSGANAVSIYTNTAASTFLLSSTAATGTTPYAVVAVDINGDNKVDLVTANQGNNTMTILTNNGGGAFALALSATVGSGPEALTAADVNLDGKLDLITANWNVATLSVMTNNTAFPSPTLGVTTSGNSVTVSWPSSFDGWTLQQKSDLSDVSWSPSGGVTNNGTNKSFSISAPTGNQFFRLSKP
ncbi:MAG: hypothetical protein JWM68_1145 [Verrucomicrobiales bacterium]|nr:hypothetical protein [Verrucomicrobiales bacterium]